MKFNGIEFATNSHSQNGTCNIIGLGVVRSEHILMGCAGGWPDNVGLSEVYG